MPMLIASTDVLNEKYLKKNNDIELIFNNINFKKGEKREETKIIKLNIKREITYLKEINITLIELKPDKDHIFLKYFIDLDDNITDKYSDLCIIHNNLKFCNSYDILSYINDEKNLNNDNSNVALIVSSLNSKVVGLCVNKKIYKFNKQTYLNSCINKSKKKEHLNEMTIQYEINNKDNDNKDENTLVIFGLDFAKNNKDKCNLIIDGKIYPLQFKIKINKAKTERILTIKLQEKEPITDMSFMFYNCKSLISLPDISKWDISNVIYMKSMFYSCSSLKFISDISRWKTGKVENMCSMFDKCESIKCLPDISNWDMSNVNNISYFFNKCKSLQYLPDISKWNTNQLCNINEIFADCNSLIELPSIEKWNLNNINKKENIFDGCNSLVLANKIKI
jgi:surface protein